MRACRVRARALIARASITLYSIAPRTNVQPTASPCRPALPATMQHHASQASTSQQLLTAHHNNRAGKVFPAPLCSDGNTRQNLHQPPLHTNGKPQQAGRVTQKTAKSSETCKKKRINLQKQADVVYIIGHNVNNIHPKMQESCQNERPPPILQDQDAPKIGERTKHFHL
uniref:Uncharacterized protein n=1 Tax=Siphoviridae sp. ctbgC51 TaxID=2827901 RepID=A0A8S5TFE5_9CAUD|nr:MAG TPA: hypothetical protein [Siphoviridae sp. ctbgC51]